MKTIRTDVLILGMGGAGQLAALNAYDADPDLDILIVTKAIQGKGGCSRMVQGGFNVVLNDADSHEKHLTDTLKGGKFINNQDLARTLVEQATPTIKEMENKYGCFFDRNADGTIHQKPFAGQSFDRTVHKGDLTGIEIISRATEQVMKRKIPVLEEHRALDLLYDHSGEEITGALLLDIRHGEFLVVEARATLMVTGGGPTQYNFFAPGPEKTVDGLGMLYRAGARMRDMEMVQFHPTGLIIPGSVVAGALLEEGLRGAGAHLFNANHERYMMRYAPGVNERATRDLVSRSAYLEIQDGRGFENGGVHIAAFHLGPDFVEQNFPGMCERCRLFGYDLARKEVPVSPTAHYVMGGAAIDERCRTSKERLFCAGEDSGGVHGANRLGGNGIADSCVFGRLAGKSLAAYLKENTSGPPETARGLVKELRDKYESPLGHAQGSDLYGIRDSLRDMNWDKVGVARNGHDLAEALQEIKDYEQAAADVGVQGVRAYNMVWNDFISFLSMLDVSKMVATSALSRTESRGAHFRLDYQERDDDNGLYNIFLQRGEDGEPELERQPVELKYLKPSDVDN